MVALKYLDPIDGQYKLLPTAGPAGPTGATGSAGPAGPPGPTGAGSNGPLDGLSDVDVTGITDGQVVGYRASDQQYVPVNRLDSATADTLYVSKAGDTVTGPITLPGDPTANLHAAPKQYVDRGCVYVTSNYGSIPPALTGVQLIVDSVYPQWGDTSFGNIQAQKFQFTKTGYYRITTSLAISVPGDGWTDSISCVMLAQAGWNWYPQFFHYGSNPDIWLNQSIMNSGVDEEYYSNNISAPLDWAVSGLVAQTYIEHLFS